MQPAALGSLFLIDLLLLTNAADRAAKTDADVERHRMQSSRRAADAYTADQSLFLLTAAFSRFKIHTPPRIARIPPALILFVRRVYVWRESSTHDDPVPALQD